jgi:ABC-type Na+ efflux pump permease subunit
MLNQPARKTYFGITALITGILSFLSLLSNFTVANLNITPETFSLLNNLTALFFCILTPLTFGLGVVGHTRKNDSKNLSRVAIVLVVIPFLFMFAQFVSSFIK